MEKWGQDKTRWDLTGLWNRLGEPFRGPDFAGAGLERSVVLVVAVVDSCSTRLGWARSVPPLLSLLSFSLSNIPGLPALYFSTYLQKLQLRGMGKGTAGSRKGLGSPVWPNACTHPALSQTKDGEPSISGLSFVLLKPCHGHAVGGMELNSANNSSPFFCNHDST